MTAAYKKGQQDKNSTDGSMQYAHRILHLHDDVLNKAENVVQDPVNYKAAWGIVQKHQEYGCNYVKLSLLTEGGILCVNGTADKVYEGHYDRENVDSKGKGTDGYGKEFIRASQILKDPP